MTRWTYEEVSVIGKDRDRYRNLVRRIAARGCDWTCNGACMVCEAIELVRQDAERGDAPCYPGCVDCNTDDAERAEALKEALGKAWRLVGFFASVIKSGEPWSKACEDEMKKAREQ